MHAIDKCTCSFLTCSLCLLVMGSESVWGLGEGSNFQFVKWPQNGSRSSLMQTFVESCEVAH